MALASLFSSRLRRGGWLLRDHRGYLGVKRECFRFVSKRSEPIGQVLLQKAVLDDGPELPADSSQGPGPSNHSALEPSPGLVVDVERHLRHACLLTNQSADKLEGKGA